MRKTLRFGAALAGAVAAATVYASVRRLGLVVVARAAVAAGVAAGAPAVSGDDTITTIAGNGRRGLSGDGGPATSARLMYAQGVAVDAKGNVYVVDRHRVRRVGPDGRITTIAGTVARGYSGDGGPATSARLDWPQAVAVDAGGNVYIADKNNDRVRVVDPGGTITTFAGSGEITPDIGDGGPATAASLLGPMGLALDGKGNVYISESVRVRRVSPDGTIATIAGTGKLGHSGDDGPATKARVNHVEAVAVDGAGNVYLAETNSHRVRKVTPAGRITTIAGKGRPDMSRHGGFGNGGRATAARLNLPTGVAVDRQGNVYIGDTAQTQIRKVTPNGTITTIAGQAITTRPGDGGPASRANLGTVADLALDAEGSLYFVEGRRVRKIWATAPPTTAAPAATTTSASFRSPSGNLSCELAPPYVYCQSVEPAHSVRLTADGRLRTCRGTRCIGNPSANARTLGYGRQIAVGRFRCRSEESGVTCTVIRSGRGFRIDRDGLTSVG
jgi:NHL repeat